MTLLPAQSGLPKQYTLRYVATLAGLAVAYFAAARFGLSLAFATKQVTAVWPPTGIALASLLLLGYRVWPAIFLGAFWANSITGEPLAVAAGIATGNTLAAALGKYLLGKLTPWFDAALTRTKDVMALALFGATVACIVSATGGTANLALGAVIPWSAYGSVWRVWWMGDALGVLLVCPLLLTWAAQPRIEWDRARWLEGAALLLALSGIGYISFAGTVVSGDAPLPLAYAVFPFLIWAAIRFGQRETATLVVIAAGIAVWSTVQDRGPFSAGNFDERLILLEAFLAVLGITGLGLAASNQERRSAEREIQNARENLEERVAQRTQALEEANRGLRASEERVRLILDHVPGIIFRRRIVPGAEPEYLFIGGDMLRRRNLTPEQVLRNPELMMETTHAEDLRAAQQSLDSAHDDLQPRTMVVRSYAADGSLHWIQIDSKAHQLANGNMVRDGVMMDITPQKEAQAALRESERQYTVLANQLPGVVFRRKLTPDGKSFYLYLSRGSEHGGNLPYDSLHRDATSLMALIHPEDKQKVYKELTTVPESPHHAFEYRFLGTDHAVRWVQVRSVSTRQPNGDVIFDGFAFDVTDQKRIEEQLRQAQRLEAVGQLTGGIAHEFNNLLQIISGNSEYLAMALGENAEFGTIVSGLRTAAERGGALTRELLAFSRKQNLQPKTIDANALLTDIHRLVRSAVPETTSVTFCPGPGLSRTTVDPNGLQNAVLNLILNARDAMPLGGEILIKTENVTVTEPVSSRMEVQPGAYVQITVSDTGVGMSPEVLARAVEPFFTTKDVGKGTGLGLSMVHGFAKQSGGHLAIASKFDHGTTVRLLLPAATGAEKSAPDGAPQELEHVPPQQILVVEDDPGVRKVTVQMLESLGCRVSQAEDGPSALKMLEQRKQIDVLLTDIVMPRGMTGPELAQEAKALQPQLKVVYMSGYDQSALWCHDNERGGRTLLWKPFNREELTQALATAMSGPSIQT